MLKIALLLVKNMFFGLNEGISQKMAQVAPKHTAFIIFKLNNFFSINKQITITNIITQIQ